MDGVLHPDDWNQHAAALRRVARKLLRDETETDDLVQGAFLTALERPPRRVTHTWLSRVVQRRALDVLRRRGREQHGVPPQHRERSAPDTSSVAARLELYEALAGVVRGLREPYRETLYLRYFEDLSPTEISARLGVPIKTVKTRLHRALDELRSVLSRRYGNLGSDWRAALAPLALAPHATVVSSVPTVAAATVAGVGIMSKQASVLAIVVVLVLGAWGVYMLTSSEPPPAAGVETADTGARETETMAGNGTMAQQTDAGTRAPERSAVAATTGDDDAGTAVDATGDLVIRVVWHDGKPAPGIAISLTAWRAGQPTRVKQTHLERRERTRSRTQPAGGRSLDACRPRWRNAGNRRGCRTRRRVRVHDSQGRRRRGNRGRRSGKPGRACRRVVDMRRVHVDGRSRGGSGR